MKQRQFALLRWILQEDFVAEKEILETYHISKRTLQYDMKAINEWLIERDLPGLKRKTDGCFHLLLTQLVQEQVQQEIEMHSILFHQMDESARKEYLLFLLFFEKGFVTTQYISEKLEMSRNSIRKILVELELELKSNGVFLESKPKSGWALMGDEADLRRCFVKWFHEVFINRTTGMQIHRTAMLKRVETEIPQWPTWMKERFSVLSKGISDRSSGRVVASIVISILRHQNAKDLGVQPVEIPVLVESGALPRLDALIAGFDFPLNHQDRVFCAKYLLGNRAIDMDQKIEVVFDKLPKIVKTMVKDMCEISHHPIREPERLVKSLIVHLQPTIFRIRFGIEVENSLLEQIQERYQGYYRAARIASRPLEQHFSIHMPAEEVAFIAMHFGAFIEKEQREQTRILLVCHEGMATVRLIQARLREEFDSCEIVGIMSRNEYMESREIHADLVLTTVELQGKGIPIVHVEPMLSKGNQNQLGEILKKRTIRRKESFERIYQEVERYCTVHQPRLLRSSIHEILEGKQSGKTLAELLPLERIQLGIHVDTWQEAVQVTAEPLLQCGAITESYHLKMMENIERFRAYVVVKKSVAMPHARPEDGALDTQASLVVLSKGVKFGHPKNDPVRVVFILTATDGHQHLAALDTFRRMIGTDDALAYLKQVKDREVCKRWIAELEQ